MPMDVRDPEDKPTTKRVTPDGLHADGPYAEWFEILDYTDDKVVREARAAATRTEQLPGKSPTQEFDNDIFTARLVKAQTTDWRSIVTPGRAFNAASMYQEDGNYFWKFNDHNLKYMPRGARIWLAGEILDCTGVIPTESLKVVSESGKTSFNFRRPPADVAGGEEPPVSAAV